jgi:hypothetical protein
MLKAADYSKTSSSLPYDDCVDHSIGKGKVFLLQA